MWPELRTPADRAAVDLTVEDQPAADPGPDGEHHDVRGPPPRAVEVLGQGGDVGVVVDEDREARAASPSGPGAGHPRSGG